MNDKTSSRIPRALLGIAAAVGSGLLLAQVPDNPFAARLEVTGSPTDTPTSRGSGDHADERPRALGSRGTTIATLGFPAMRVIGTEDGPFGRPHDVLDLGDKLIVLDGKPLAENGHQLLVLDKRTGTVVASNGPRGQGPSDLESPNGLQADREHPGRFWVNDYLNGRMALYDVDDVGAGPLDFVRITGSPFQAYWIGDSLWTPGRFPDESLRRYERRGPETVLAQEIGEPLYPDEPISRSAQWNRSTIAVHPDGHSVVAAFVYDSRLRIYDVAGELTREIVGPVPGQHDFDART